MLGSIPYYEQGNGHPVWQESDRPEYFVMMFESHKTPYSNKYAPVFYPSSDLWWNICTSSLLYTRNINGIVNRFNARNSFQCSKILPYILLVFLAIDDDISSTWIEPRYERLV